MIEVVVIYSGKQVGVKARSASRPEWASKVDWVETSCEGGRKNGANSAQPNSLGRLLGSDWR